MDLSKVSHDILNSIERLRIMHDLLLEKKFGDISQEEIKEDLEKTLKELDEDFKKLF